MRSFLIISLISNALSGQGTYILTDTLMTTGIKLIDGGRQKNARFCQVEQDGQVKQYTPFEVKAFGLPDGKIYQSYASPVQGDTARYFLEKVVAGKLNLYYLRTGKCIITYYLNHCDTCRLTGIPLVKDEFIALLTPLLSDCEQAVRNIPSVSFRRTSLVRFISDYNACAAKPVPRIRYGISIGLASTGLSATDTSLLIPGVTPAQEYSEYLIPVFKNDRGFMAGAFLDVPFYAGNFSFHPEVIFKQNGFSQTLADENLSYGYIYNYFPLSFPLSVRYSILNNAVTALFHPGLVAPGDFCFLSFRYSYSCATATGTMKSPIPGKGGTSISGTTLNNRAYVLTPKKEIWEFNPDNDSWGKKRTFREAWRARLSRFRMVIKSVSD